MPNEAVRPTGPRSRPGSPVPPRRGTLRRVGRRARLLGLSARGRWRRSLQLRVATYTTVASAILVVVFGVLVVSRTTSGLVHARVVTAERQLANGERYAQPFLNQLGEQDPSVENIMFKIVTNLGSQSGGAAGTVPAILFPPAPAASNVGPIDSYGYSVGGDTTPQFASLRKTIGTTRIAHEFVECDPTTDGSTGPVNYRPCLAIGMPVPTNHAGTFQLVYLYSLDAEQTASGVTRDTVIVIGTALVILLGVIAWFITRLVVRPVRLAARTAQRLSAGLLDQRMEVRGEDDLALLGASFNQMAVNLQRQIVRLEEMSRLQRRFTSDVSHELRTPLTTVRMAADLLFNSRDGLDPMMARSAELLHAELDRFDELMTDLLEISRFDAGFAVLDAEPTDLVPAVYRVVRGLHAVAEQAGVEVSVHVPESAIAEVDPRRAERILRNLVGNAIEHGEGRPVEVRLAVDSTAVAMTVRDHGIGLKPGEEKLVFNRFWRADPSRARQTGGTGLGLSISLEDARLHGGWLEAWGAPGQGAQFRLVLPVRAGGRLTESPLPLVPEDADVSPVTLAATRVTHDIRLDRQDQIDDGVLIDLDAATGHHDATADLNGAARDRRATAADRGAAPDHDGAADDEGAAAEWAGNAAEWAGNGATADHGGPPGDRANGAGAGGRAANGAAAGEPDGAAGEPDGAAGEPDGAAGERNGTAGERNGAAGERNGAAGRRDGAARKARTNETVERK